ncbi:MAG TPA: trypsin-like peptidase domain-containing protein [Anaerolineae bacterium]|nr:trypsin-like peptidase domain-containing protein [Anaerolineae bacterium]
MRYSIILLTLINLFLLSACTTPTTATPPPPPPTLTLPAPAPTIPVPLTNNDLALIDAVGRDFAEQRTINVYQQVAPSVVNITTQVLRRSFFFEVYPEEGSGSGFVLDKDGHIITNHHVINGAQQIEVSFGEEVTLPATLVGSDPNNDIAVLKVNAPPDTLQPVSFGDATTLQVGQRAIAIGNPFGQFDRTLTTGVVSALDRTLSTGNDQEMRGLIQTDTAINRGNSGGPLLDSAGRVIGINTAIFSPSGTSAGVGFAVPVSTLQRVLPDLLAYGYYRRPWLGIRYVYELSPAFSQQIGLDINQGLLLVQFHDDSPLSGQDVRGATDEAILGNRRLFLGGDVITAVDNHPITSLNQLNNYLETTYQVGQDVTLTLVRNNQTISRTITLTTAPR